MGRLLCFWLLLAVPIRGTAQESAAQAVARLVQNGGVQAALDAAKANEPGTIETEIKLCEIPAPGFKEAERANEVRRRFAELGLLNVRIDKAGNVLGERPGTAAHPHLVFSAHLDTVFPEGTDVHVKRDGPVLRGPGISDDCRGLAVMLGVIRALDEVKVSTPGSITFVATVGEEGLGNTRGVKHLYDRELKGTIDRFVSVDGSGNGDIVHIAVGSKRYRVTYKGLGGHSYGAFGIANPVHALGRAIAKISDFRVPATPKTTFNVGVIGGGTSVNSIAFEARMEVDIRSADAAALQSLDVTFHKAVDQALLEENERWGNRGKLMVTKDLVGDRPPGQLVVDAPIVQIAAAVDRWLGLTPHLGEGSTDANYPISLGLAAITVSAGGRGQGEHSLSESFDVTDSWKGTQAATLLAIALSQL